MLAKRQTEVTTETHELTIIRFGHQQTQQCSFCGTAVAHVRVTHAASALSLSETALFRLAESGQIHSIETAAGSLLLCGNSLAALGSLGTANSELRILKGETS